MKFDRLFSKIKPIKIMVVVMTAMILISACSLPADTRQIVNQILDQVAPSAEETSSVTATEAVEPQVVEEPTITPTPTPLGPTKLTIWVPPQFDPGLLTPAGVLMRNQIAAFEAENQDIFVDVRVKAESGSNGMLESLAITQAAATEALPALVALPRSILEDAVRQQLVYPIDDFSTAIDEDDWYDYSRSLSLLDGSTYGLPFAGDAMLLVYRETSITNTPTNWDGVLSYGEPLAFPAADKQALFTLNLYLSAYEGLEDEQRHLSIDETVLNQIFQLYQNGGQAGVFPLWLTEFQLEEEVWTAYNENRSNWAVVWASTYLQSQPSGSQAIAIPSLSETPYNMADGWVWCLSNPHPEQHAMSAALAEYLVQPDFLDDWSRASGTLPVRPSSLQAWNNPQLSVLLGQVAQFAQIRPRNEVLSAVGPVIEDHVVQLLSGQITAEEAAQFVLEKIGNP